MSKLKSYCFYNPRGLDDLCAAAIVRKAIEGIKLIKVGSVDDIDISEIEEGSAILILGMDYQGGYPPNCIDNHVVADESGSLALTCWHRYFKEDVPRSVYEIAMHSIGDGDTREKCTEFIWGLRLFPCDPNDDAFWSDMLEPGEASTDEFLNLAGLGEVILRYQVTMDSRACLASAFYLEFDDYAWVAINHPNANPMTFQSCFSDEVHDGMVSFYWGKGFWNINLFQGKSSLDVGEVARKFGGDGDRTFAWFQAYDLPFLFPRGVKSDAEEGSSSDGE